MAIATDLNADTQALDAVVAASMERCHIPGVAVGILHDGQELVTGHGVTNVDFPLPVDGDTLFQIGSTSKTFTATAAMRLVEQGKLDLDAPIRTYIPSLRMKDEAAAAGVTMRHLFTHTAGWVGDYFWDTGRGDDALEVMVERMAELDQLTPLGESMSYNNAGYYLAGRVIEVAMGKPFEAAMQGLVLDPLGMDRSFYFPEDVMTFGFAAGHSVKDGKASVLRPWALARSAGAAGGITSSARDQLKYARFHLGDGTGPDGTRLLSRESLEEMQRAQSRAASFAEYMGVSWRIFRHGGATIVGHGGGTYGQASAFEMVPERNFAITVLTNTGERSILDDITIWAYEHFLGLPRPERTPLKLSPDVLQSYAGLYTSFGGDAELYVKDGEMYVQGHPRGGFPTPDVPPPPTPPPARIAFYAEDFVFEPDSPPSLWWGEFVRRPDGSILGFHSGARLFLREAT